MNVFNGQPPGEGSDSDVECLEEAQAEAEAKHAKDIAVNWPTILGPRCLAQLSC